MATRVTLKEMQAIVQNVINNTTIADEYGNLASDTNALSKLMNKICEQVILDGNFIDKLPELDAKELPYGSIIEEFYQGLLPVRNFGDVEGKEADVELSPAYPDYEEPAYSETMARQYFKTTLSYDEYNSAFTSAEGLAKITNLVIKRLYDSYAQYRYDCKKGLLGRAVDKIKSLTDIASTYAKSKAYSVGNTIKDANDNLYIVRKQIPNSNTKEIAGLLEDGSIVELKLQDTLAIPTNATSGAAFIKSVKEKVEEASFATEGNSLAGNTIGAEEGLVLFVKKGVMPAVEVETLAGAFNKGDLAIPATVKIVEDFGDSDDTWAMLVDSRAIKLHPQYFRFGETQVNGGDYVNMFLHSKQIGFISKFAFMHIWKKPE